MKSDYYKERIKEITEILSEKSYAPVRETSWGKHILRYNIAAKYGIFSSVYINKINNIPGFLSIKPQGRTITVFFQTPYI